MRITKNYATGFVADPVLTAYKSADSVSRDLGKHLMSNCMILRKYETELKVYQLWNDKINELQEIARQYDVLEDLEDIFSVLGIHRN